jgi:hypothetical protein
MKNRGRRGQPAADFAPGTPALRQQGPQARRQRGFLRRSGADSAPKKPQRGRPSTSHSAAHPPPSHHSTPTSRRKASLAHHLRFASVDRSLGSCWTRRKPACALRDSGHTPGPHAASVTPERLRPRCSQAARLNLRLASLRCTSACYAQSRPCGSPPSPRATRDRRPGSLDITAACASPARAPCHIHC